MSDAAAKEILAKLVPEVEAALKSGSSNVSMVRWRGNLDFEIQELHGKVIMNSSNETGGTIAVTKRQSALIGAEHNIYFYSAGKQVAKVYLCTYYNGSQPRAQMIFGDESFVSKSVVANGSTCLAMVYKPDAKQQQARVAALESAPVIHRAKHLVDDARAVLASSHSESKLAVLRFRGDRSLKVNIKHYQGRLVHQEKDEDQCGGIFAASRQDQDRRDSAFYFTFFRDGQKLGKVFLGSFADADEHREGPIAQLVYGHEYFDVHSLKENNGCVLCLSLRQC